MSLSRLSSALTGTTTTSTDTETYTITTPVETTAITYQDTTLSLKGWSRHTGISEPTLRYRHKRGWSPAQVLGYDVAPQRDRAVEQAGRHQTNVTIVENGEVISRRVAAAILKIELQSLRRRLKQYRDRGEISLTELKQSSRRL